MNQHPEFERMVEAMREAIIAHTAGPAPHDNMTMTLCRCGERVPIIDHERHVYRAALLAAFSVESQVECGTCQGCEPLGKVWVKMRGWVDCPDCHGSGRVPSGVPSAVAVLMDAYAKRPPRPSQEEQKP